MNYNLCMVLVDRFGGLKLAKTRTLYDVLPDQIVTLVGLGAQGLGIHKFDDFDEGKENVRKAIGAAVKVASKAGNKVERVTIDPSGDPQASSEGAHLASYVFDELKNEKSRQKPVELRLAGQLTNQTEVFAWNRGQTLAKYQNVCKRLKELPANLLTPSKFAEEAKLLAEPLGVQVIVHDRQWAEQKGMNSFLSVSNGSVVPPKFVELHYFNAGDAEPPIVFVGKGITFDSGGISLKPASNMDAQRADMGGAANVLSSITALAALKSKVNIIGLIPLTENMPSGSATKPGDVVVAMNGKTIQINNTDAEGRLVLADALTYADTFNPRLVVDIATLTGAVKIALGQAASAVYSTSDHYWQLIHSVGQQTGDRVWRMPLFSAYSRLTKDAHLADMLNMSKDSGYGGGSCVAAAFLKEFTTAENWIHIDMAATKTNGGDISYLSKGMSGRPIRTLVSFFEQVFTVGPK
jgi:aminopeptidase